MNAMDLRRAIVIVAVAGASGCDVIFPLEDRVTDLVDAMPPYDRCVMSGLDDPLRYAELLNPNVAIENGQPIAAAWSWDDARADCLRRGMDLAVPNDEHELGQTTGEGLPFWVGQRIDRAGWSAVDGCAAFTPSPETTSATSRCGAITGPLQLASAPCDGVLGANQVVVGAACETPRPATTDCLPNRPERTTYTISPRALGYAEARAFCTSRGAKLLEPSSRAELARASELAIEQHYPRFWIGSTFDGTTWNTESTCPAVYSWTQGRPELSGGDTCVAASLTARSIDGDGGETELVLDGVAVTSCANESIYALCETG